MLPIINININEVLRISDDIMNPGKFNIVVQTFAYNFNEFLKGLEANNENADRLLSKKILYGIMQKQFKGKILFFYSPHSEYTFISAALLKLHSNLHWLSNISGYCEYGQDYLKPNAKPFLFWDGINFYRIYDLPEYDPDKYYVNDFGSFHGLYSAETDQNNYERIELNKANKTWDYSVVPKVLEEIITYKNKKFVLLHSRYTLIK